MTLDVIILIIISCVGLPVYVTDSTVSVLAGDEALLSCILPPHLIDDNTTVYWTYNNDTISENENVTSHADRFSLYRPYKSDWYLRINPTMLTDAGEYTCTAGETFESAILLIVESRPEIVGYDTNRIYLQACRAVRLTMWCNVTGLPFPSIKWFFKKTDTSEQTYISLSYQKIFIQKVFESNTGIYICDVTNKHGRDYLEYHVSVIDTEPCVVKMSAEVTHTTTFVSYIPTSSFISNSTMTASTPHSTLSVSAKVTRISPPGHVAVTAHGSSMRSASTYPVSHSTTYFAFFSMYYLPGMLMFVFD